MNGLFVWLFFLLLNKSIATKVILSIKLIGAPYI